MEDPTEEHPGLSDPGLEMEPFWAALLDLVRWRPSLFGDTLDFYDQRVDEPESMREIVEDIMRAFG